MLNSVGLANPGLAAVRRDHLPWLMRSVPPARVIVNVVGFEIVEYAAVIEGLEDIDGITAYELNLSCPNTSAGGIEFGADPACVAEIIAQCRGRTRLPLIAKLSPVPHVSRRRVARDAGADGFRRTPCRSLTTTAAATGSQVGQEAALRCSRSACVPWATCGRTGGMPVIGVGLRRRPTRGSISGPGHLVAISRRTLDPRLPERHATGRDGV
jgi:hypothetical protein